MDRARLQGESESPVAASVQIPASTTCRTRAHAVRPYSGYATHLRAVCQGTIFAWALVPGGKRGRPSSGGLQLPGSSLVQASVSVGGSAPATHQDQGEGDPRVSVLLAITGPRKPSVPGRVQEVVTGVMAHRPKGRGPAPGGLTTWAHPRSLGMKDDQDRLQSGTWLGVQHTSLVGDPGQNQPNNRFGS